MGVAYIIGQTSTSKDPLIGILNSDNVALFKTACAELSNRNAREILRAIGAGVCTSGEIAERTQLSIQNVLLHLNRLEKIGILTTDGNTKLLKGRSPRTYRILHFAILLIPNEIARSV